MIFKAFTAAILSAAILTITPAERAHAGNGAAKAIIGLSLLGGAAYLAHRHHKKRSYSNRSRRYYSRKRYYSKRRYSRPRIAYNHQVAQNQTMLNRLGYHAGSTDGKRGPQTRRAVRQFQAANGFPQTGILAPHQIAYLNQQVAALNNPAPVYVQQPRYQAPVVAQYQQPVAAQQRVVPQQLQAPQVQYVQPVQPRIVQPHAQQVAPVAPIAQTVPYTAPAQPSVVAPKLTPSTPTIIAPQGALKPISTPAPVVGLAY